MEEEDGGGGEMRWCFVLCVCDDVFGEVRAACCEVARSE